MADGLEPLFTTGPWQDEQRFSARAATPSASARSIRPQVPANFASQAPVVDLGTDLDAMHANAAPSA